MYWFDFRLQVTVKYNYFKCKKIKTIVKNITSPTTLPKKIKILKNNTKNIKTKTNKYRHKKQQNNTY